MALGIMAEIEIRIIGRCANQRRTQVGLGQGEPPINLGHRLAKHDPVEGGPEAEQLLGLSRPAEEFVVMDGCRGANLGLVLDIRKKRKTGSQAQCKAQTHDRQSR